MLNIYLWFGVWKAVQARIENVEALWRPDFRSPKISKQIYSVTAEKIDRVY